MPSYASKSVISVTGRVTVEGVTTFPAEITVTEVTVPIWVEPLNSSTVPVTSTRSPTATFTPKEPSNTKMPSEVNGSLSACESSSCR